jgi:hypothetical protein
VQAAAYDNQFKSSYFAPIEGVATYCIYGSKVKTPIKLKYPAALGTSKNAVPSADTGPGDGLIPIGSLSLCDK